MTTSNQPLCDGQRFWTPADLEAVSDDTPVMTVHGVGCTYNVFVRVDGAYMITMLPSGPAQVRTVVMAERVSWVGACNLVRDDVALDLGAEGIDPLNVEPLPEPAIADEDTFEAHQQWEWERDNGGTDKTFEDWLAWLRSDGDRDYEAYMAAEMARGNMAFEPHTMECYACAGFNGVDHVTRRVVKLGNVVEQRRDATQTYVLECGHVVI
jgi:hypothetical protein